MDQWEVKCAHQQLVEVSSLKPHPKNPNKHSLEQVDKLSKIIAAQGWRRPVRVSKLTGFVTVGHGALEAAKHGEQTHVPVDLQDYVSETQEYEDMVADNAIAAWSELDLELIKLELPALNLNIDHLGIKDFVLPPLLTDERQEDGIVFDRTHEQYTGSIIKQIVLFFKADEFPNVVQRANVKLDALGLKDYSELFVRLLDEHDRIAPAPVQPEAVA